MARLSSVSGPVGPDPTAINLTRMVSRLQQTIITPESKLRTSSYEREKVATNIEYARTLLLRLEQDALQIKQQNLKQASQADLLRKRDILDTLSERLSELHALGSSEFDLDGSSDGEDLLGEDTPNEGDETPTDDQMDLTPPQTAYIAQSTDFLVPDRAEDLASSSIQQETQNPTESSTLRTRNTNADRVELFASAPSASSTGIRTTTEALLTHNRTEQESLTSSLLNMAQQLNASSRAFAQSLEEEKSVLDRATEGLDKNELAMEAAQKRMGYLRTMTEGKGWWGRMMMYAWIAGLAVLALVIVFVLPKLRF